MAGENNFNKYFSGGLGKGGQAVAWLVAFSVVGVWQYYEMNRINAKVFTKAEQEKWNGEKKSKK